MERATGSMEERDTIESGVAAVATSFEAIPDVTDYMAVVVPIESTVDPKTTISSANVATTACEVAPEPTISMVVPATTRSTEAPAWVTAVTGGRAAIVSAPPASHRTTRPAKADLVMSCYSVVIGLLG